MSTRRSVSAAAYHRQVAWRRPRRAASRLACPPARLRAVWQLSALGLYSMDYGADGAHGVYDILKANFDAAYGGAGNRAPLPIYIHSPWLTAHAADIQRFVGQ